MYAVYLLHCFFLFIFYFFIFVRKTKNAFIAIVRLSGQEVDLFRSDYPHFVSTFTFLFLFGSFCFYIYIFVYNCICLDHFVYNCFCLDNFCLVFFRLHFYLQAFCFYVLLLNLHLTAPRPLFLHFFLHFHIF